MPIMLLHFRSNPTTLGFAVCFLVPVLGSDTVRSEVCTSELDAELL